MKRLVILNPEAQNGGAANIFHQSQSLLEQKLGRFEVYITRGPNDATEQVRQILKRRSAAQILVAGGDGTVNEVVNGYFQNGRLLSRKIPLGIINLGTGGDFYKSIIQQSALYDISLKKNSFRMVDCCRLTVGKHAPRYFINIGSAGIAGIIINSLKTSRFQWGAPAYFFHTLKSLLLYRPIPVRIRYREQARKWEEIRVNLTNFFACNAQYSGGGMHWAPNSSITDGKFDVVVIPDVSKFTLVKGTSLIYAGRVKEFPRVMEFQAREIVVSSTLPINGEIDGEIYSVAPNEQIRFELLPRKIPLIL